MGKQTPLADRHSAAGAKIVDFGGWDMPLHYGSQLDEHHAVRTSAGVFDVSHMTVVDVFGDDAADYLKKLLANDVSRLGDGKGLYSCMLNESGGVVDDLIVYRRSAGVYRVIVNAGTRDKDIAWMEKIAAPFALELGEYPGKVMLAIQGPEARELTAAQLPGGLGAAALSLKPFCAVEAGGIFVARTGYTGEDGFELVLDAETGNAFWDALLAAGVATCGLGARDTLRMEAGLNLYGQDMDEQTSPLISGLGWTVAWEPADREFVGRGALESLRDDGPEEQFIGLILDERGIMRHGQRVLTEAGDGVVTSGGFSPTMQASIALARVPADAPATCHVEIRNNARRARVVAPPFVRKGRVLVQ